MDLAELRKIREQLQAFECPWEEWPGAKDARMHPLMLALNDMFAEQNDEDAK